MPLLVAIVIKTSQKLSSSGGGGRGATLCTFLLNSDLLKRKKIGVIFVIQKEFLQIFNQKINKELNVDKNPK